MTHRSHAQSVVTKTKLLFWAQSIQFKWVMWLFKTLKRVCLQKIKSRKFISKKVMHKKNTMENIIKMDILLIDVLENSKRIQKNKIK